MTDTVKAWIEERRAIHEAATDGPWVAEYSGETGDCVIPSDAQSTREAVALTRLFHRTADANAIADAHNMFLRALDALNAVLELHVRDSLMRHYCSECSDFGTDDNPVMSVVEYPCLTVQAIEGAINE